MVKKKKTRGKSVSRRTDLKGMIHHKLTSSVLGLHQDFGPYQSCQLMEMTDPSMEASLAVKFRCSNKKKTYNV